MRERALMRRHAATALIFLAVSVSLRANNADSLAWMSLRARVAVSDSVSQAIGTADALAAAGLYADAAEILRAHAFAGTDTAAALSMPVPGKIRTQWRISSGVDYYRLEDVDTMAMTPEELRDYQRLTETPLSVWLRIKSAIQPAVLWIEEIAPNVYVSEHTGRIETSARLSTLSGQLRFEPSVKAEKRFRADASGHAPLTPANAQPSDMGGASLRIAFGTASRSDQRIEWIAPLSIHWEHYRADRPGYESFVDYRCSPSLEMRFGASPVMSARFAAEARFEDYYRPFGDSLDVVRLSGRAEWYMRTAKIVALASGAWMGDRYTNASGPETIDRFEGAARGEYKATQFLTGRLRLRGIHEREEYGSFGDAPGHEIDGSELTVEPSVETLLGRRLNIAPELLWERRFARINESRFVWGARTAWEPRLRAGWSSGMLEAAARAGFRAEDVGAEFERFTADSRSFLGALDLSATPITSLTISLFADYQFRRYAPFGSRSRVSENLTVSASAAIKL